MRPIYLTTRVLALLFVILATPKASAQCRAADDSSYNMVERVKKYSLVTSDTTYNSTRIALALPAITSASQIALVTKASTCKSANTAYQAAATGARQTLTGRVYVVHVGTSYVVWDPWYQFNTAVPADIYMVFDSQWVKRSIF